MPAIAPPDTTAEAVVPPGNKYSILPEPGGVSFAPRELKASRTIDLVDDALTQANAKGGIATPESRMATADVIKNTYNKYQPETGFLKGLAQGLMGNPNWRNAATQGVIKPVQEFDKNGKGVVSFYAENSDMPIRVIDKETEQDIPAKEYEKRGFRKYKNITDTPGYIEEKKRTELYTDTRAEESGAANVAAAVFPTIGENSSRIINGFSNLRKYGLSDSELNDLQKATTRAQSISSAVSSAMQEFRQANETESLNKAIDKINQLDVSVGIPKIVGSIGKDTFKNADGTTITKQDLLQKMSDYSKKQSTENQLTQNREQIVKEAVYKKLEGLGAKAEFDNILNLIEANERLKSSYKSKYGEVPVFASSLPYQIGQPIKVGMANAIIDKANSEIANAYNNFFMEQTKDGVLTAPGAISAAFRRSGIPSQIFSKYAAQIDEIQSMPDIEKAPEPAKAEAKPPSQPTVLNSEQKQRLQQTPNVSRKLDTEATGKSANFTDDWKKFLEGRKK